MGQCSLWHTSCVELVSCQNRSLRTQIGSGKPGRSTNLAGSPASKCNVLNCIMLCSQSCCIPLYNATSQYILLDHNMFDQSIICCHCCCYLLSPLLMLLWLSLVLLSCYLMFLLCYLYYCIMRLTCHDAGYGASSKRSHTLAAAAIDALHTALVDPEDCKHLLLITYNVTSPMLIQGGLHAVINSLQAYPPAQMTAGACLARLCTEVSQK